MQNRNTQNGDHIVLCLINLHRADGNLLIRKLLKRKWCFKSIKFCFLFLVKHFWFDLIWYGIEKFPRYSTIDACCIATINFIPSNIKKQLKWQIFANVHVQKKYCNIVLIYMLNIIMTFDLENFKLETFILSAYNSRQGMLLLWVPNDSWCTNPIFIIWMNM